MIEPPSSPVTTGNGKEVAGEAKDTPPTKRTHSRPSRTTVMNGRRNIAYFFDHIDMRDVLVPFSVSVDELRAMLSLVTHFSRIFEIRRIVAPMIFTHFGILYLVNQAMNR